YATVTGVQTCALPIWHQKHLLTITFKEVLWHEQSVFADPDRTGFVRHPRRKPEAALEHRRALAFAKSSLARDVALRRGRVAAWRSEERRVGQDCILGV